MRAWSAGLQTLPLDERLTWCWHEFSTRAVIGTRFQGAGPVILHRARELGLPFAVFTLGTGLLFPETERFMADTEQRLGIAVERLRPAQTVAEQTAEHGPELWRSSPDLCCALR